MVIKVGEWLLILFNAVYLLGFTVFYISIKNYEFLVYIAVVVVLFLLVLGLQRKVKFSGFVLWALSIWGLLHMMGGGVKLDGVVLYGLELLPLIRTENYFILRFDQFVHAYLYFVMTFVVYHLAKPHLSKKMPNALLYLILLTVSMGIGAGNEIVEFSTVLFFENTGVGGYYNTAWDLVFNTLGALIAIFVIHFRRR
jgi:uncharacterized membrane protein YjdF